MCKVLFFVLGIEDYFLANVFVYYGTLFLPSYFLIFVDGFVHTNYFSDDGLLITYYCYEKLLGRDKFVHRSIKMTTVFFCDLSPELQFPGVNIFITPILTSLIV